MSENISRPTPAMARVFSISSVAYATEDNASELKIARAAILPRRSCTRCAVGIGRPRNARLTAYPELRGRGGRARTPVLVGAFVVSVVGVSSVCITFHGRNAG